MRKIESPILISYIMNKYNDHGAKIEEINLFGVRNKERLKDSVYNDTIGLFTNDFIILAKGTTDPSAYYIETHPINKNGTAIMCLGFHENIWVVDKHGKAQVTALCNRRWKGCRKQRVRRLDTKFNYNKQGIFTGYYSCNFHPASKYNLSDHIGKWSAGCIVTRDYSEFQEFMRIVLNSKMKKKKFSFFLFDKEEIIEELIIQ